MISALAAWVLLGLAPQASPAIADAIGIVEASAGGPLASATVEALAAGGEVLAETRTGADGRFELAWPGAVATALRVQAAERAAVLVDVLPPLPEFARDFRVVMRRLVSLEGELLRADGTPCAGAMLELVPTAPRSSQAQPASQRLLADAAGRFHFASVQGGQVVEFAVHVEGHMLAQPLVVAVGEEPEQRVALRLPALASLEVLVLGLPPELTGPEAGTMLLVPDVASPAPRVIALPAAGPVRFADLDASAAYDLVVSREGHWRTKLRKVQLTGALTQVTVSLPAPLELAPELRPSWSFSWVIVDEIGRPLTQDFLAPFGFLPIEGHFGALLTEKSGPAESVLWLDVSGRETRGRVTTQLAPPVRMCTTAMGETLYDGSIRPGDEVVLRARAETYEVAEIALEIVDESGNPTRAEEVLCRDLSDGRVVRVPPRADGRHAMRLEPGRYAFQASARGTIAEAVGPLAFEDFAPQQVRLAIRRTSAVTGRVVLERATEGEVQLVGATACGQRPRRAALGPEGQFLATGVPPGAYRLVLLSRAAGAKAWSVRDLGELSIGEGAVHAVELAAGPAPERPLALRFHQPGLVVLVHVASGVRCVIERESPGDMPLLVAPGDYRYRFYFASDGKLASEAAEWGTHAVAADEEPLPLYLGGCRR